jgi:putative membrane protein
MMGAADAVPGVSGGTIAFITGIYQELIQTLSKLGPTVLQIAYKQNIKAAWGYANANFLCVLLLGMLSSLILLSNVVLFLLTDYPQILWGFFFGLIAASSIVLSKSIEKWNKLSVLFFVCGTLASFILTTMSSTQVDASLFNIFLAGMLAICAMILPGISGSFILLLLGLYTQVLSAVKNFEIVILIVFAAGCAAGLLSFSRLLNWLFDKYQNLVMALLTGFLLGSLNKVWPWKETLTTRINSHGLEVADQQQNISPFVYQQITGIESQLVIALFFAVLGAILVLGLDKLNNTYNHV